MSKELIGSHSVHETLVRQTQIDAARIEELEREIERKMSAAAFVLKERDALQADNARLREALENCRLLAARHRKEEWAGHVLRLCESAGVAATALRSPK